MENVQIKIEKNIMTITVDLKKVVGPSKSGKTEIIATTSGNMVIDGSGGAVLGLNVYRKTQS